MQFRQAVAEIKQQLASGTAQQAAVILAEERGWRTALMGLAPRAGIPLHDHPRTRGMLLVEAGSVAVRRYDVAFRPPHGRMVRLNERGSDTLRAGDHDWIGRTRHNLHTLEAGNEGALIFSVRHTLGPPEEASLYACIDAPGTSDPAIRLAIVVAGRRHRERVQLD